MCAIKIANLDPDEVAIVTLRSLQFLLEKDLLIDGKPEKCIDGEIDCPYCDGKLKYWQSSVNGHRGFTCDCIDGATYQE